MGKVWNAYRVQLKTLKDGQREELEVDQSIIFISMDLDMLASE